MTSQRGRLAAIATLALAAACTSSPAGTASSTVTAPAVTTSTTSPGTPASAASAAAPAPLPQGVAFWTASTGLLAVTLATPGCWLTGAPCPGGLVELTTNGGHRWRTLTTVSESATAVSTAGATVAWVSEGRCSIGVDCPTDRLLETHDRGRSWTTVRPSAPVRSVSVTSATTAWAIDEASRAPAPTRLVHTVDAGRSWQPVSTPCTSIGNQRLLWGVSFPTDELGWLVCIGQAEQMLQSKTVFRTTDGGAHWGIVAQSCPTSFTDGSSDGPPGSLSCIGNFPTLSLRPDGVGWLWGGRGGLHATTTNGSSWTPIARQLVVPDTTTAMAASLTSDTRGYLLVSDGYGRALDVTRDAGLTWQHLDSWPPPPGLR